MKDTGCKVGKNRELAFFFSFILYIKGYGKVYKAFFWVVGYTFFLKHRAKINSELDIIGVFKGKVSSDLCH